jgi:hypothetical protein
MARPLAAVCHLLVGLALVFTAEAYGQTPPDGAKAKRRLDGVQYSRPEALIAYAKPGPASRSAAPEASSTQAANNALAGEWLLPDGGGVLVISAKGDWLHPRYGAARIREASDEADIKVFYQGGDRCSYRTRWADGGKTLILTPTDNTQDSSYCPMGELKMADK